MPFCNAEMKFYISLGAEASPCKGLPHQVFTNVEILSALKVKNMYLVPLDWRFQ